MTSPGPGPGPSESGCRVSWSAPAAAGQFAIVGMMPMPATLYSNSTQVMG
jgi:hypothetical protein